MRSAEEDGVEGDVKQEWRLNCVLIKGMWLVVLIVFEFSLRESRIHSIRTSRKLELYILYSTVQYTTCNSLL